jgi:uncharacterized protein YaiI (UPF0178 family)
MEIYVDGDACPVKTEVVRVADRHGFTVHMVSNSYMGLPKGRDVRRKIVPGNPDAADDWIAENIAPGDICITADIPLADRCLKAKAGVLGPTGKPFTEAGIGSALAMRDVMAHMREIGESKGGGPPFNQKDRSRFLNELEQLIQAIKRGVGSNR